MSERSEDRDDLQATSQTTSESNPGATDQTVQGTTPEAVPRRGGTLLGATIAEVVGTFILVFIGAGTVVALQQPLGGVVEPTSLSAFAVAVSLSFGFAVAYRRLRLWPCLRGAHQPYGYIGAR